MEPKSDDPRGAALRLSVPSEARGMQGQRAGILSRFMADAIDLLIVIAAVIAIHLTVSGLAFLLHPRDSPGPR